MLLAWRPNINSEILRILNRVDQNCLRMRESVCNRTALHMSVLFLPAQTTRIMAVAMDPVDRASPDCHGSTALHSAALSENDDAGVVLIQFLGKLRNSRI